MRSSLVTIVVFSVLIGAASLLRAQPTRDRATIKGEVVDLWCYLEGGDRGAATKACATSCAKAGNPVGLVDANGNYVDSVK